MSGVTAIRQRKQWTADLDTLTEGIADWGTGVGTPIGSDIAWEDVITISGNTESSGASGNVASWSIAWGDVQNPRYSKLTATFAITYTERPGFTAGWGVALQQFSPLVNASATGTGPNISATIELDVTPSARPTSYSISFYANEGDTATTGISGTITLEWS